MRDNASSIMLSPASALEAGTPLTEAVALLRRHQSTGLPVVNAGGQLLGFVSEHDCIQALLNSGYHCDGEPMAEDVMTPAQTVSPETSIVELAQRMSEPAAPRVFPVVAANRLVGLVNRAALLEALAEGCRSCRRAA